MKAGFEIGASHTFVYRVPEDKTVPYLYREASELVDFPKVFATGFMIALMEWTCVQALAPHLEPGEGSLGVHVDVSHLAATPPGFDVTVTCTLCAIDKRRLTWSVSAHDGNDRIGAGTHARAVIDRARFDERLAAKAAARGLPDRRA